MRFIVLITLFFKALTLEASVSPMDLNQEKVETDKRWSIEVDEDLGSLVSEKDFYEIIAKVYSLYSSNSLERNLQIGIQDWQMPYFSAWAYETDEAFTINFWGGFARIPGMTRGAFALTACHEVGHILGGEPYHTIDTSKNMSAEGQADFFAAAVCFKNYLITFGHEGSATDLLPFVLDKCRQRYLDHEIREICFSTAKAGQDLAAVLTYLGPEELQVSYETPSPLEVEETLFNSYPTIQCRLDTFLAGALQQKTRPSCWFYSGP